MGPEADSPGMAQGGKVRGNLGGHHMAEVGKGCSLEQEVSADHYRRIRSGSAVPSSGLCAHLDHCILDRYGFHHQNCSGSGVGRDLPTAAQAARAAVQPAVQVQGNQDRSAAAPGGKLADWCTAAAAAAGGTAGEHNSDGSSGRATGYGAVVGHAAGHARCATAAEVAAVSDRPPGEDEDPDRGRDSAVRMVQAADCIRTPERAGDIRHGRGLHDLVHRDRLSGVPAGMVGHREHSHPGHSSEPRAEGPGEAARSCMPSAGMTVSALWVVVRKERQLEDFQKET
jgi:hypothetical protein